MRFNSPERALKWAYETISRPIVNISCIKGSTSEGFDIGAHDRHAEAALILAMCERILPTLHMAYVRIQFGREAVGLDVLSHHLAANFGTGVHSRRSIELIIRAYCGQKIGLREIRRFMNCGMLKAVSTRNLAYDALDAIHAQAMDRLHMEMDARGLLNSLMVGQA